MMMMMIVEHWKLPSGAEPVDQCNRRRIKKQMERKKEKSHHRLDSIWK